MCIPTSARMLAATSEGRGAGPLLTRTVHASCSATDSGVASELPVLAAQQLVNRDRGPGSGAGPGGRRVRVARGPAVTLVQSRCIGPEPGPSGSGGSGRPGPGAAGSAGAESESSPSPSQAGRPRWPSAGPFGPESP
jgi:hypothetical protein